MSDEKCCTGCNIFFGGEIRHIKECVFYPESLTEIYDIKDEENAKLKEENARLREALESIAYLDCPEASEIDYWELKADKNRFAETLCNDTNIARKALERGE